MPQFPGLPSPRIARMSRRAAAVLFGSAVALGLVAFAAVAPPAEASRAVRMYVIGDSWSAGLHADPRHTLMQVAGASLGWNVAVNANSGTGYLNAPHGRPSYVSSARALPAGTRADVVVVQGGSNDHDATAAELDGAVDQTVAALQHTLPRARVVLLGPGADPWPLTPAQLAIDAALGAEAHRLHVTYISMIDEHWLTAKNVDTIIDPQTHHPTVAGHRALGHRLATDLRRIRVG